MDKDIQGNIIVVTYEGSPWISECIAGLVGCKYPIHLCINPKKDCPYDPGAFYYAEKHGIEKFIILHDSMVIKDQALFDIAFSLDGNVAIGKDFFMCLGKFELKKVLPLPPKPIDKMSAINFEGKWLKTIAKDHFICPELIDKDVFVEKHGEKRMVLENKYLIKYKGTWVPSMVSK